MEWMIAHIPLLYSILLTLSLFNIVILLWLGMTVLLYAAKRTSAVWLAGLGLVAGALFFVSHTAFVVQAATGAPPALTTWWPVGWMSLIYAPYAWYLAILWHVGYWSEGADELRRRHRLPLGIVTALALGLLAIFITARPMYGGMVLTGRYFVTTPLFLGMPLLVLVYPVFVFLCIGLSFEALMRPGAVARPVQQPARLRARPWLITATISLLGVSVLMLLMLLFLLLYAGRQSMSAILDQPLVEAYWLDIIISLAITAAVVSTGQAVVAYEIFTGRTLPRRGLRRQWHEALVLAGGFSAAVSVSFAGGLHPIYTALIATVLLALVFSLLGWRAHLEHQRSMEQLRPFAASEHSFEALLGADASEPSHMPVQFAILCRDVLASRTAYLLPAGGLSTLIGRPLTYPENVVVSFDLASLLDHFATGEAAALALDPTRYQGAIWAVPLWGAQGLVGVFLLGEKSGGGLYSQEEIEIARSGGERLLDTLAVVNLARRLMLLQRQRYVETQVIDQQSRRALHDEVLPSLHSAMLSLRGAGLDDRATADALAQLGDTHRRISALLREMPAGRPSQVAELGLLGALRKAVSDESARDFHQVNWRVEPEAEERARTLPPLAADIAFYAAQEAMRNAARHGRGDDPTRPLCLTVEAAWRDGLELRISDDGVGTEGVLHTPAAGHGLALHSTLLAVIGGSLEVSDRPGAGTTATVSLPDRVWQVI
jgi:signal transduction histidine kinase